MSFGNWVNFSQYVPMNKFFAWWNSIGTFVGPSILEIYNVHKNTKVKNFSSWIKISLIPLQIVKESINDFLLTPIKLGSEVFSIEQNCDLCFVDSIYHFGGSQKSLQF